MVPRGGFFWPTVGSRRFPPPCAPTAGDVPPVKALAGVAFEDEYSRECLAIVVARRLRSTDVLETLAALCMTYGVSAHIRSDNGSEFTAALVRLWLEALDVQTLFIEPGSPWENGYVESFNGKLRDELLDREIRL